MFATFKLVLVYLTLGPIAGIIGIPYTLLLGDISLLYRVAMWITNAGVRAAGIKIEISGLENIPSGRSCIFMSNHVSNLDPPVVLPLLPGRSSVLLKKELMNIPILGRAMRLAKFVPVTRGHSRDAAQASVEAAADALRFDGIFAESGCESGGHSGISRGQPADASTVGLDGDCAAGICGATEKYWKADFADVPADSAGAAVARTFRSRSLQFVDAVSGN
jgi:1-acyl-sn-glycerol-3-phosphate acyltransferase